MEGSNAYVVEGSNAYVVEEWGGGGGGSYTCILITTWRATMHAHQNCQSVLS